jgi:tellurite resistance protein
MLFQLRKLNEREQQTITDAPIWVGILIGCADGAMVPQELKRIEEVIKTKTFSEHNDVHYLYTELANNDLNAKIENLFGQLKGTPEEKSQLASAKLAELNTIFEKINPTYAKQFRESLHSLAVEVAKASGGVFGIGRINHDERELIDLPMINKL